jgi:hypothetical protein
MNLLWNPGQHAGCSSHGSIPGNGEGMIVLPAQLDSIAPRRRAALAFAGGLLQ